MDMNFNQHVVPHKKGWAVKRADAKKAQKVFELRREAILFAKEIARKNNVCVITYNSKGKFDGFDCDPKIATSI